MKKAITLALVLCVGGFAAYKLTKHADDIRADVLSEGEKPVWLEADSAAAIDSRIRSDFSLSLAEAAERIRELHPGVTDADIDTFIARHYIEAKTIDGEVRIHRKSPRNLGLLNPEYNGGITDRGYDAKPERLAYVDSVLSYYRGKNSKGLAHKVKFRFSIDVPYDKSLEGDSIRVWMPVPLEGELCDRQEDVEILSTVPADYVLSGDRSVHNTISFVLPAPAEGDTAHFEYVGSYVSKGKFVSAADVDKNIRPYDKSSDLYKRYTAVEAPHVVRLDSLARAIVGDETNPHLQSELVADYIMQYPWAGAREYSTIKCIPEYVLRERHGDCGQVSLLYISLMRSLGVPARWESGWMIHPGEKNYHDWAEVYFEGVGWVPVDVSFGRYGNTSDADARTFYSHGMDAHRFATNKGVCGDLYPAKRFVRSETVDFQAGEVECSRGNLFYPGWDSSFTLLSVEPVEY